MYTQSSISSLSTKRSKNKIKQIRKKANWFCDQFNHLYRNKQQFSQENLFRSIQSLTLQFIEHLIKQKPTKPMLQDVISNNLSFGWNTKNKDIVFFHIKLTQCYIKSKLNVKDMNNCMSSLNNYHLLENQFDSHFNLNLSVINDVLDQKIKKMIERAFSYLFKLINIKQNNKHVIYLNFYLNQCLMTKNFLIFFQIINNYFNKLIQKAFSRPFIDINSIFTQLFTFNQVVLQQNEKQFHYIINKYIKIMEIQMYQPYIVPEFQKVFSCIINYCQNKKNKQKQGYLLYLYNILIDMAQKGIVVNFKLQSFNGRNYTIYDSVSAKLDFFFRFYVQTFKNTSFKSLSDIDLDQIKSILNFIQRNINCLIVNQHNFVRVVDKVVNEIQKIKRNFIRKISQLDILFSKYSSIQTNTNSLHIIQHLNQIQKLLILNKNYLAIDNFKNTKYLTTSGLIDITISCYYVYIDKSNTLLIQTLRQWITEIKSLNIQKEDVEIFYINIVSIMVKKISQLLGLESKMICLLFQPFQYILSSMQQGLLFNSSIQNYMQYIIKKLIRYLQHNYKNQQLTNNISSLSLKDLNSFINRFTLNWTKHYFKQVQLKHKQNITSSHNPFKIQSLTLVNQLFCLNSINSSDQQFKTYIKIFNQNLVNKKIGNHVKHIRNQSIETLQSLTIKILENLSKQINPNQFLLIQLVLKFIVKLNKIKDNNKKQKSQQLNQTLKHIDFIMHMKKAVSFSTASLTLIEYVQNFQKAILGLDVQEQLQKTYYKINNYTLQKQSKIELLFNVIAKKIYFACNPDIKTYENNNLNSIQKNNNNLFDYNQQSTTMKKKDRQVLKTKRQNRQQLQKYYQKCIYTFENSCTIIAKAKNIVLNQWKKIKEIIDSYPIKSTSISQMQFVEFNEQQIQKIHNLPHMLGFIWNILWILKLSDLKTQLIQLLKVRLGIFSYYAENCKNKNILLFQIQKLNFLNLISAQKLSEKPKQKSKYNRTQLFQTQQKKSLSHKLLLNQISQQEFSNIQSHIFAIIYAAINFKTSKHFRSIIASLAGVMCKYQKITQQLLAQSKVQIIPFLYENYSIKKKLQRNYVNMLKSGEFQLNINEILYPLMTLVLRKMTFLIKKTNQLSQMRSFLTLLTGYFSKIGLAIYYHQLVQIWVHKNIKVSIIKVIDCYRCLINSSQNNLRINNSYDQKSKILQKIDRILCNKRRSLSTHFSLKIIVDLIKSIRSSSFSMKQSISKIILYQFKQQFNLYNYEIFAIYNDVYGYDNKNGMLEEWYTESQASQFQLVQSVSRKIVFQKESFKCNKSLNMLNQIYNNVKVLIERLPVWIAKNYVIGKIAESCIGFYLQKIYQYAEEGLFPQHTLKIIKQLDLIILKIALNFLQFDYEFKSISYSYQQIQNISKSSRQAIYKKISQNTKAFNEFTQQFPNSIQKKVRFLQSYQRKKNNSKKGSQNLQFPLSIVYPLRNWVYNISLLEQILVTKVDTFNFDHTLNKVEQFIEDDSEVMIKYKSVKQWWKARNRLDRQMAKILDLTNLGVFDVKMNDTLKIKNQKYKKYNKLIYNNSFQIKKQLQNLLNDGSITEIQKDELLKELTLLNEMLMIDLGSNDSHIKINQNLLILTVNRLTIIPFERIKSVQKYNGVYRLPSIRYIMEQQLLRQNNSINYSILDLGYTVNSHNDLKETQQSFYKMKQTISNKLSIPLKWQGLVRQKPQLIHYRKFMEKQVYLYMGHGFGTAHIKDKQFYQLKAKSICMMFGCSSINMSHSNCEVHGMPLIFLKNQCPGMLGALWDVTDKDTDLLTAKIFEMVVKEGEIDFSYCVSEAKKQLKLPNMNGNAIIVYGLPTNLCV